MTHEATQRFEFQLIDDDFSGIHAGTVWFDAGVSYCDYSQDLWWEITGAGFNHHRRKPHQLTGDLRTLITELAEAIMPSRMFEIWDGKAGDTDQAVKITRDMLREVQAMGGPNSAGRTL